MDKTKILAEESVGKLLLKFSLPAIVGMLVNALYSIADSIFVGRGVGDTALAAVGFSFPISTVLMGFGMLVGIGAGAVVSIRLGENKKHEAEKILANSLILLVIISLLLTIFGLVFLEDILKLLNTSEKAMPYALSFNRILIAGCAFQCLGFGMNNIIRAEGNPTISMATMLISAGINIVLNPIFIFVFKLGISGSALATIIAQFVSTVWVLSHFCGKKSHLKFKRENFILKKYIVLNIFSIGMSPFLMQIAASVVTLLFNSGLSRYGGDAAVSAMTAINRVSMLILMPIFGINQGAQPIIGYNYGAGKYERVKEALRKAIIAATTIVGLGFIATQLFSKEIIAIFNDNPKVLSEGASGMKILLFAFPVVGFQIVSSNYFQAIGKAKYSIFLSLLRQVIVLIPLLIILPLSFKLIGVWIAGPISDLCAAITTAFFIYRDVGKLKVIEAKA